MRTFLAAVGTAAASTLLVLGLGAGIANAQAVPEIDTVAKIQADIGLLNCDNFSGGRESLLSGRINALGLLDLDDRPSTEELGNLRTALAARIDVLERDCADPTAQPEPSTVTPAPDLYANCDAVRAANAAPLARGTEGYRTELDSDGDGVACELVEGPTATTTVPENNSGQVSRIPSGGIETGDLTPDA